MLKRRDGRVIVRGCLVPMVEGRRYKFFWQGCNKGTAGVGVFIAEILVDSVVNVVRVNERIMYVKLVIGKQIVNIVSAYAPQVGLSVEEKDAFGDSWNSLVATWMAMLEEMQTGMVASMVVWDLVQETLKVKGSHACGFTSGRASGRKKRCFNTLH